MFKSFVLSFMVHFLPAFSTLAFSLCGATVTQAPILQGLHQLAWWSTGASQGQSGPAGASQADCNYVNPILWGRAAVTRLTAALPSCIYISLQKSHKTGQGRDEGIAGVIAPAKVASAPFLQSSNPTISPLAPFLPPSCVTNPTPAHCCPYPPTLFLLLIDDD